MRFQCNITDVISKDPEELLAIKGLGEKSIKTMLDAIERIKAQLT